MNNKSLLLSICLLVIVLIVVAKNFIPIQGDKYNTGYLPNLRPHNSYIQPRPYHRPRYRPPTIPRNRPHRHDKPYRPHEPTSTDLPQMRIDDSMTILPMEKI